MPIIKAYLICLVVALGFNASAQTAGEITIPSSFKATINDLYLYVQTHAPSGLLNEMDMKILSPYLSKSLYKKMSLAETCEKDWELHNHGKAIKAPFAWSEFGLFSGANERISPESYNIDSITKDNDGSFYVVVVFRYRHMDGSGIWHVTDHVILEDGNYVLDDVLFNDESQERSSKLTGILSQGCKGSHWVGLR
jgi:hypothetical protein